MSEISNTDEIDNLWVELNLDEWSEKKVGEIIEKTNRCYICEKICKESYCSDECYEIGEGVSAEIDGVSNAGNKL